MDWNCVYLTAFRVEEQESGKKVAREIKNQSGLDPESDGGLQSFLEILVKQMKSRRPSLTPTAACKAYQFSEDALGQEDEKVCEQLLHAVSLSQFNSYANILAGKYVHSPKSRKGILFVINANVEIKKNLSPCLLVFKTDFQPGFIPEGSEIAAQEELILPELKKGLQFPYFDGANFQFNQLVIFQKSQADYFQRMLRLQSLPDNDEIVDEALHDQLEEKQPGAFEKYFRLPEEDRRVKREVFGAARIVQDNDLLQSDDVVHVTKKTQAQVVDNNAKPVRLRLSIDDGLRFEGKADQLNQSYYFAQEGMEKFLIIRGHKFETRSHFQAVEFMKLERLDEVLQRISADQLPASSSNDEAEIAPDDEDMLE